MRIAVSVKQDNGLQSKVALHFGRCPFFAFVDLDGQEAKSVEIIANPHIAGHAHGQVPAFIKEHKADVMLSGGMGSGAISFFEQLGIATATGASGTLEQTLEKYFKGELSEAAPCRDGEGHHHRHGHGSGRGQGRTQGQGKGSRQGQGQGSRQGQGQGRWQGQGQGRGQGQGQGRGQGQGQGRAVGQPQED